MAISNETMAVNYVLSLIFHFQGHLRFYPVLPFTQVVSRFYPITHGKTG